MPSYQQVLPLDGGWGWMIVVSASIMMFCVNGTDRVQAQTYEIFMQKLSHGQGKWCVWAVGMQIGLRYLLAPLGTILCHAFGARAVVVSGGIVRTIGILLSIFAKRSWQAVITFGLLGGIGSAMAFAPTITILRSYFEKHRMLAFTIAASCMAAGHFVHPLIMQVGFDLYGSSGFLYVWAAVALHVCVAGALLRPLEENYNTTYRQLENPDCRNLESFVGGEYESIEHTHSVSPKNVDLPSEDGSLQSTCQTDKEMRDSTQKGQQGHSLKESNTLLEKKGRGQIIKECFSRLWPGRSGVAFMVTIFTSAIGYTPVILFSVDILMERGEVMDKVVFVTIIINTFDVISRLCIAFIFDRDRFKAYRKRLFMIFPLTTCLASVGFALTTNIYFSYIFFAIGGISISNINGICYVVLSDLVSLESYPNMVALTGVVQGTGHLFGSFISGVIYDACSSYEWTLVFAAIVFFVGFLSMVIDDFCGRKTDN